MSKLIYTCFSSKARIWLGLIVLLSVLLIALAFYFNSSFISNQLSMSNIRGAEAQLTSWVSEHAIASYTVYVLVIYLFYMIEFPLCCVMPVLGGYFLPTSMAIGLFILGVTLALLTMFIVLSFILNRYSVPGWLDKKLSVITRFSHANRIFLFVTSRLALCPSWVISYFSIQLKLSWLAFLLWSLPASIIFAIVYVYIGIGLGVFLHNATASWSEVLAQKEIYFVFLLAMLVSLLPLALKYTRKLCLLIYSKDR